MATRLETIETRKKIWDLRLKGLSTSEIAELLDLSHTSVSTHIRAIVRNADATRLLEHEVHVDLARLEAMIAAFWPYAVPPVVQEKEPSIEHAFLILKILERKAKLLGMDAPKRVDVRALVVAWAEKEGLDPEDVFPVVKTLLPTPNES